MAGTPARGYSWEQFKQGNAAALTHGARSPRVIDPIVAELVADLSTVAPWTARLAFAAEVSAWANAEARCRVLRHWADEHGVLSDEGLAAAGELARAEARASSARDRLGLSPLALAKLLSTFATAVASGADDDGALDRLKAEGAAILAARSLELGQPDAPAELDQGGDDDGDGPT